MLPLTSMITPMLIGRSADGRRCVIACDGDRDAWQHRIRRVHNPPVNAAGELLCRSVDADGQEARQQQDWLSHDPPSARPIIVHNVQYMKGPDGRLPG